MSRRWSSEWLKKLFRLERNNPFESFMFANTGLACKWKRRSSNDLNGSVWKLSLVGRLQIHLKPSRLRSLGQSALQKRLLCIEEPQTVKHQLQKCPIFDIIRQTGRSVVLQPHLKSLEPTPRRCYFLEPLAPALAVKITAVGV